jgi:hypothetical protein
MRTNAWAASVMFFCAVAIGGCGGAADSGGDEQEVEARQPALSAQDACQDGCWDPFAWCALSCSDAPPAAQEICGNYCSDQLLACWDGC